MSTYTSSVSTRNSLISPSKALRFAIKRYNLRLQTIAEWMSQHVASPSHLPICLLSACSLLSDLASLLNCTCLCLAWFLLYSWTNILTVTFELGLQVSVALYHTSICQAQEAQAETQPHSSCFFSSCFHQSCSDLKSIYTALGFTLKVFTKCYKPVMLLPRHLFCYASSWDVFLSLSQSGGQIMFILFGLAYTLCYDAGHLWWWQVCWLNANTWVI